MSLPWLTRLSALLFRPPSLPMVCLKEVPCSGIESSSEQLSTKQALSQCPVVDKLIVDVKSVSLKTCAAAGFAFPAVLLDWSRSLFFFIVTLDVLPFGVILVLPNYPLDIRHFIFWIVLCRDWEREVLALRTFSIYTLYIFCVT